MFLNSGCERGIGDELFQSISALTILYLPYYLSALAHMNSYYKGSLESVLSNIFSGPLKEILQDTHKIIHEHTWIQN